jgi:phosphoenolpyruvate carboxykinase (ATP)
MENGIIIKSSTHIAIQPIARIGLSDCQTIFLHLSPTRLVEHAIKRGEGDLTDTGALMCQTGTFTGRSPKDRFIVYDAVTATSVNWGEINQAFDKEDFNRLHARMLHFLAGKKVYVRYAQACASNPYRMNLAVVTTQAWQNLFCHHLFLRPTLEELENFDPEWTILSIPEFKADRVKDGTRRENFTIINFSQKIILVGGSGYAGEIKKAIFSVLNFMLPMQNILPMHCAANVGKAGDTALFFGLSGTGKTTLSADPQRKLIGDDEHGWSGAEVFNFEGGCYAKVINLDPEREPQIFEALRFGAILENTRFLPDSQTVNFADRSVTENTRAAYPISYIAGALEKSVAAAPQNIFFLTADAFGVLPPLSRLPVEQAIYHFLSGYTSKLAGTEMGITEPVATFSACFGAAFLPLHPFHYARLLGELIRQYKVNVWLVNTGWVGGPYGVGSRIRIDYTRSLIGAALAGKLAQVPFVRHELFDLYMPTHCPGVPDALLNPQQTWADPVAYQQQAQQLANAFRNNFSHFGDKALVEFGVDQSSFSKTYSV